MSVSMLRTRAVTRAGIALTATAFLAGLVLAQAPPAAPKAEPKKEAAAVPSDKPGEKKEVAVIKTNMGTIVFEFLPDVAPKMVANFVDLAKTGFYNGTTFHRVINGFMIQGGDPLSKDNDPSNDGTGNGPRRMPAEFTTKYSHVRGMVSTARGGNDINSGSCQFFIVQKDSKFLDNQYTIFGRVLDGMDVVDKISLVPKDKNDRPIKNVTMESVTLETR
ncbi:MAG TPA: peptidylprolyl isomerase [Candidatus Polarisedimenticolia bacterium]|jgi:cyclophilin family peptidyl-prolyl cis-trans isomerase|nr:peptidylprolyl isomerase [Candidatus Polarisedimenticolia bacterium]